MKRKKIIPSAFRFWRENKLSNEFTLTLAEIKKQYREYLETRDADWILYYGHQTVSAFISDKDGLNSTGERDQIETLMELLAPVRHTLPCYAKP